MLFRSYNSRDESKELPICKFWHVARTSRLSRLVAFEWWSGILRCCSPGNAWQEGYLYSKTEGLRRADCRLEKLSWGITSLDAMVKRHTYATSLNLSLLPHQQHSFLSSTISLQPADAAQQVLRCKKSFLLSSSFAPPHHPNRDDKSLAVVPILYGASSSPPPKASPHDLTFTKQEFHNQPNSSQRQPATKW